MRIPKGSGKQRGSIRGRVVLVVVAVFAFAVLTSLHGMAVLYTDFLWFESTGLGGVWRTLAITKLGLSAGFSLAFFVVCWVNLSIAARYSSIHGVLARIDPSVRPIPLLSPASRWFRLIMSIGLALLVGAGASSEWRQWLLFTHAVAFPWKDPLFHLNASFYVFRLPFLIFLLGWSAAALIVVGIAVIAAGFLGGSIHPADAHTPGARHWPRAERAVKAHLSVILAGVALLKGFSFLLRRYSLVYSTAGFRQGALYSDVHAALPALTLMAVVSMLLAVLLLVNLAIRSAPMAFVGVGIWVALSVILVGIYPAFVQRFVVQPSQLSTELPYIGRNIQATRYALGLSGVHSVPFKYSRAVSPATVAQSSQSLASTRIWDPATSNVTFQKLQDIRAYYTFNGLSVNRYVIDGTKTPVLVGVRELNSSQLPAKSWVNEHLQFTHGYGAVVAMANKAAPDGNPYFVMHGVPQKSKGGMPTLKQPSVYFALNQPGYVIANSKQAELDYQSPTGASKESHYAGSGGVRLSSSLRRAAFALRFGDLNILISNQITSSSRIMFVRSIQARVAKAVPFLKLDSNPYPVLLKGQLYWVQDAYTTTSHFPYAQSPNTSNLPPSSGLANGGFNYVRNSVKVLVNAYNGKMTFYAWNSTDPLLKSYEAAFPHLFTPASQMPQALRSQLRYPYDLFSVQAAAFGRYHITNPVSFYNAGNAWTISADPNAGGSASTNASPSAAASSVPRMPPQYAMVQLPGSTQPHLVLMSPFVPLSSNDVQQTLTAFLTARVGSGTQGNLSAFVMPSGSQIDGPDLVNAKINENTTVSSEISLLDQHGSVVHQGTVMLVPVGNSILYVRPLYVSSSQNPLPEVKEVIAVYGNTVVMQPTLSAALDAALGTSGIASQSSNGATVTNPAVNSLIHQASAALSKAQSYLRSGNLAGYQAQVTLAQQILAQVGRVESHISAQKSSKPASASHHSSAAAANASSSA